MKFRSSVTSIPPVYITENGQGDLVVMSIETYEKLVGKFELYKLLDEGMDAMKSNKVVPAEDVFKKIPGDQQGKGGQVS